MQPHSVREVKHTTIHSYIPGALLNVKNLFTISFTYVNLSKSPCVFQNDTPIAVKTCKSVKECYKGDDC